MAESRTTNKELKENLSKVQARLGKLVDDFHVMKEELGIFKQAVAKDLRRLVERTNKEN